MLCCFFVARTLLFAARAGVFVALPAGNYGPGPSTAVNNALGAVAVAASTMPRDVTGVLQLGSGALLEGVAAQSSPVGPLPLIYAGNASAAGVPVYFAQLCVDNSLDPALVKGKIVVSRSVLVEPPKASACSPCHITHSHGSATSNLAGTGPRAVHVALLCRLCLSTWSAL